MWTVAIVAVTGAAGVLVARSSGSRGADGSITGEIRSTAREMIFEAQSRLGEGDMAGAIAAYDEALQLQPSNVEALTYRGWLTSRRGDRATAVEYLDDAIAVDPAYPDARLFRAILALEEGDGAQAATELAVFDSLDPAPYAEELLAQARVRERVAEARDAAALQAVDALAAFEERPPSARPRCLCPTHWSRPRPSPIGAICSRPFSSSTGCWSPAPMTPTPWPAGAGCWPAAATLSCWRSASTTWTPPWTLTRPTRGASCIGPSGAGSMATPREPKPISLPSMPCSTGRRTWSA